MRPSLVAPSELRNVIANQVLSKKQPCVVGIAGGSASGKTTIARYLSEQLDNAALFSQDLFQLGSDFHKRKTSPYKWDDPENFALPECATALATLKKGAAVQVPAFDVVANQRIGTVKIKPAECIIWEGIYALGDGQLRNQVDISVFVDVPYVVRLLRRIARFFNVRAIAQIDDLSIPARQMLTFVWSAERDFVQRQQHFADYCVSSDEREPPAEADNFTNSMLQNIPSSLRTPYPNLKLWETTWNGLQFILRETSFEIHKGSACLYVAPIAADLIQAIYKNIKDIIVQV